MPDYDIKEVLMRRDGMSEEAADQLLEELYEEMLEAIGQGEDPGEILMDQLGLEPEYLDEWLF
jgi:hypothetical protein